MTGLDDHHGHGHDHAHPTAPDADAPLGYYQTMEVAVRELLIAKGINEPDRLDVRSRVSAGTVTS